jgi:prefoldin subunit 5
MCLKVHTQLGINVIQKLNKNRIKWLGLQDTTPPEVKTLNEEENQLEQHIATMQGLLTQLNTSKEYLDYGYITEEDIKLLNESNPDDALLVVHAPVGTQINIDEKDDNYIVTLNTDTEEIKTHLIEKDINSAEEVDPKLEDLQRLSNISAMYGKS